MKMLKRNTAMVTGKRAAKTLQAELYTRDKPKTLLTVTFTNEAGEQETVHWVDLPLGKEPDQAIADRLGVSRLRVSRARERLGIKAFSRIKYCNKYHVK